jgi:3-deoxy-D-manno-octulosonic-acid transferase
LPARKFSDTFGKKTAQTQDILIIDRIGYLRDLYALADVAFVGKSLRGSGGQNMLEPLSLGKPTLVGPRTENFRDVVRIFMPTGALIEVSTPQELVTQVRDLMTDPQRCAKIGQAAKNEIARHQGATEKTVQAIEEILGP